MKKKNINVVTQEDFAILRPPTEPHSNPVAAPKPPDDDETGLEVKPDEGEELTFEFEDDSAGHDFVSEPRTPHPRYVAPHGITGVPSR